MGSQGGELLQIMFLRSELFLFSLHVSKSIYFLTKGTSDIS